MGQSGVVSQHLGEDGESQLEPEHEWEPGIAWRFHPFRNGWPVSARGAQLLLDRVSHRTEPLDHRLIGEPGLVLGRPQARIYGSRMKLAR